MKLIPRVYTGDIRNFEDEYNTNILTWFNDTLDIKKLVDIMIYFNHSNYDNQINRLKEYIEEGNTYVDAWLNIMDSFTGRKVDEQDTNSIEASKYDSLTELLYDMCKQMLQLGISYSEFWSMNTKEMYTVAEGLMDKQIDEFNKRQDERYIEAAMIGQAVWGKLKKPKHIDKEEVSETVYTNTYGEITRNEYNALVALGWKDTEV